MSVASEAEKPGYVRCSNDVRGLLTTAAEKYIESSEPRIAIIIAELSQEVGKLTEANK